MLVLSTGHLTEEVCNQYLQGHLGPWWPKEPYGWFVYVYAEDKTLPQSLHDCLDYARGQGCEWVMFDRDGPFEEELTVYDW